MFSEKRLLNSRLLISVSKTFLGIDKECIDKNMKGCSRLLQVAKTK